MSFIEKKKRHFGDRRDGVWVKDAPSINVIMSGLYPNRTDCEVSIKLDLDITELLKYIEKKNNSEQKHETKLFHCIIAMLARIINERRSLNRFVQNARIYERDEILFSFVAKRQFSDEGKEELVTYKAKASHNVDDVSRYVLGEVEEVRKAKGENNSQHLSDILDTVAKFPRLLLILITASVRFLDKWGWVPKSLTYGDPAYSTVLLSNLGSIKCPSVYHHLNNYGTNSILITIGTMHKKNTLQEDGSIITRDVVDITAIADERIADGFYFARSLKLLNYICANPEILDIPFETNVELKEM